MLRNRPCANDWRAIVEHLRVADGEAMVIVESRNLNNKAFPAAIWDRGAPEEGQAYSMIGRVIWSWTRFE